MKKKQHKPRKNQKRARKSAGTNKGCRYVMTNGGLYPLPIVANANALLRRIDIA